jgi:hypothetical protein
LNLLPAHADVERKGVAMISFRIFRRLIPATGLILILGAAPVRAASNPAVAVQPEPVVMSKSIPRHAVKRSAPAKWQAYSRTADNRHYPGCAGPWCGVRMVLMVGIAY